MRRKFSIFVIVAISTLLQYDCSKQSDGANEVTGYYISAVFNSEAKAFTEAPAAKDGIISNFSQLTMWAFIKGAAQNSLPQINLFIARPAGASVPLGTYTQGDSSFFRIVASYIVFGSGYTTYVSGNNAFTSLPLKIVITKKDSISIQGSFQGAFYTDDFKDSILVTDGKFDLPFK